MPSPLPGSPEFFFNQIAKFLRENAQGDVRCLILTQTSTKQFWISSMIDDMVWQWGMLKTADETISLGYRKNMELSAEAQAKELAEQELRAADVQGKPQ